MTLFGGVFYAVSAFIIVATVLAVTSRNVVHAVVYLVISFFGTALLFYLLGAPFLAALEVIVYAGAIMVLFLFVVMTIRIEPSRKSTESNVRQWLPAMVLTAFSLAVTALFALTEAGTGAPLKAAMASPLQFGKYLFQEYWFSVEIASFLLFVALVGGLYLGRSEETKS
jgi:NADH-quinone oxidoreductase subunit J